MTPRKDGILIEIVKVEQTQKDWVAKARALSRKVLAGAIAQVKKRDKQLKVIYGPKFTRAILVTSFFTLFLPIPGICLVSVALIGGLAKLNFKKAVMQSLPELTDRLLIG